MISQRDSKGRFLPGNKARQGKSGKSYAQILREVLDETASRKIIKKAVEQAADGDAEARRWLFSHVMPKLHVVQYENRTEGAEFDSTGNPFDRPASEEMRLMWDACQTIEEVDFLSKIMDRAQANLPSSNPFEDFMSRPMDDESKRLVEAMTPEERSQYTELIEKAAERHRTQPVRPINGLPRPS